MDPKLILPDDKHAAGVMKKKRKNGEEEEVTECYRSPWGS